MGLFTTDLYRSFAAGFALGAIALFASLGSDVHSQIAAKVIPTAEAAAAQ